MGGFAWVTLATNDSYSLGALVLAHSLRQVGTAHQLAVLVTPGVTGVMREKLAAVFNVVKEVNILDSRDEANLRLLQRPELGITFTKLHCWRLTQFDKCVFLDADTMVLANADELFEREEFSAAPDVGWPDCFNSGVFVFRPSEDTYSKLVQFALEKGSFDGGDQGLLNLYFSDWAYKDISKHLPFIYNMCSTACYSYLPAFKQFGGDVKIIHFIGNTKPWLQYFDTESRQVQVTPDLQHLRGVVQRWWDVFCSLIHPALSPEMAPSRAPATYYLSFHSNPFQHNPFNESTYTDNTNYEDSKLDYRNVWDPWDDYEKKHDQICDNQQSNSEHAQCSSHYENNPSSETLIQNQEYIKVCQSDTTDTHNISSNVQDHFESHAEISHSHNKYNICNTENTSKVETCNVTPHEPAHPHYTEPAHPHYTEPPLKSSSPEPSLSSPEITIHTPECNQPAWPHECEPASSVTNESALHDNPSKAHDSNAGLAGAFARLTLGVARTAEQSILEDHLRRQGWEVGNIDYMGRDSFDNIWSKICETLASPPQSEAPALVPAEPAVAPPAQAAESSAVPVKTQVPEPVKASETDSTPKEAPVKIEALAPAEAPPEVAKSVAPPTETQKPVESCPLLPSPAEAAKPAPPTEPIQPIATAPPSDPAKPASPSEPLKPTLPSAPTELTSTEPPKPTPPSEPPKPVAPPSEPPKPVAPPSEPPKPVAPPSEPPKPAASEPPKPAPVEPSKPAAAPSEPPKPAAPSESPKSVIASTEPSKPAATPSEPPKPAAPPSEPSKPVASSEPPKPAAVVLPSEPAKPVVPAPEAKVPESPKPVASPPSEPPKPVSVPPSEPPKQEPKQPKPKASPAAKPEPEKAPEAAAGATKGPASGKQTKAAPEAKTAQPKPESEKAEAAAAPPKSSKTPPTSPLPGAQPKAVPTKEPTSPTPEAAPSAEGQAASGAQGPTPPPRKTGGGGGGGSKKGGKGKK